MKQDMQPAAIYLGNQQKGLSYFWRHSILSASGRIGSQLQHWLTLFWRIRKISLNAMKLLTYLNPADAGWLLRKA